MKYYCPKKPLLVVFFVALSSKFPMIFGNPVFGSSSPESSNIESASDLVRQGETLLLQGHMNEAIAVLKRGIELDMFSAAGLAYLGIALLRRREDRKMEMSRSSQDLKDGAMYLERALRVIPVYNSGEVRRYMSIALEHLNLSHQAVDMIQQGLEVIPNDHQLLYSLGRHLDTLGRLEEAHDAYLKSHHISPSAQALTRAAALKQFTPDDPDLTEMENLLESVEGKDKMYLQFGLAKAYDDCKDYDRSFQVLSAANAAMRDHCLRSIGHQDPLQGARNRLQAFKENFPNSWKEDPIPTGSKDPIFIVGLPRSGSTLLEKILSSHSQVSAGGEDTAFTPTVASMMAKLGHASNEVDKGAMLRRFGEQYVSEMRQMLEVTTSHFTDKMLDNFWQIGWIWLMVPNARIINAVRNPVDTCLSGYKQPLEGSMGVLTSDLTICGEHYLVYREMMQYWHSIVPEGFILDMHYESLVQNQEAETRKLLDFVGLEWEADTLSFHSTKSTISTASVAQVRKPMYKSAVGRWRKYEKHIQPLLNVLGDEAFLNLDTDHDTHAANIPKEEL